MSEGDQSNLPDKVLSKNFLSVIFLTNTTHHVQQHKHETTPELLAFGPILGSLLLGLLLVLLFFFAFFFALWS
jgi:hypothetical protein